MLSASASAEVTHPFVSSITEANGKALIEPWGMSFDSSGNLLVGDAEGKVIDRFTASGGYLSQIGAGVFPEPFTRSVAVNTTTGFVYVAESGPEAIFVFKPKGGGYELVQEEHIGGFVYVAVDNSNGAHKGDVYVSSESAEIRVYKPNAEGKLAGFEALAPPPGGFELLGEDADSSMAVNPATGEFYVTESNHEAVSEYGPEGKFQRKLLGTETPAKSFSPTGVAIDSATGDIYVLDTRHKLVDQFSAAGEYLGQLTGVSKTEHFSFPVGVAVEGTGASRGQVYVSDGHKVDIFGATARPTFYECQKLTAKPFTGKYIEKTCTTAATTKEQEEGKKNKYELAPGTGAKGKAAKGKGGSVVLHVPGASVEVKCKSFKDESAIATPSTFGKTFIELKTCETPAKKKCTSAGEKAGTVKTNNLDGTLGYISASPLKVGVALRAESGTNLIELSCEGGPELAVSGSAIGEQTGDINAFNKAFDDVFSVTGGGLQSVTSFEGGVKDELVSKVNGSGAFPTGLSLTSESKGEELKVKA